MAASIPFVRGQNVTLRLYQDGKPITIVGKNWSVDSNAAEIADPVNGELRDRLDLVMNYYSGSVDVYQSDESTLQAMMDAQDADDAQGLPLSQTGAVQKNHRDGTRAAYLMQGLKLGPWSESASGRTDAVMLTIKFRFQYYKTIPSI